MRRAGIALAAALAVLPGSASAARAQSAAPVGEFGREQNFRRFVEGLWPEARGAGISRATFDDAFRDLAPDEKVVALTRKQGEFSRPISAYVTGAVSAARVSQGKVLAERWRAALDGVERTYGVSPAVVLAIWASESGYGASTGGFDIVRALATLAFVSERKEFFRREVIAALTILQDDGIARSDLKGSWAGAMGQPQFMPSSFLAHAVDGDGDGRRDIWRSVPDVLASIGHFLARSGWKADLPWGFEVRLPAGIDLSVHERDLAEWSRLGAARTDGRPLPRAGRARLFLPAGIEGPAFILTDNWEAIRAYNTSDAYALAIGLLSDSIASGPALSRAWPTAPVISGDERREVHRRLSGLGFYKGTPDGKFGAQTRDAVRQFQLSRGFLPDGYADRDVLEALRR